MHESSMQRMYCYCIASMQNYLDTMDMHVPTMLSYWTDMVLNTETRLQTVLLDMGGMGGWYVTFLMIQS